MNVSLMSFSKKMARSLNIIVVVQDKLITIDSVLPLLMELNSICTCKIYIISPDNHIENLEKNNDIMSCINSIGAELLYLSRSQNKLKFYFQLLRKFAFKRNFLLKFQNESLNSNFLFLLKIFSSLKEVFLFHLNAVTNQFINNCQIRFEYGSKTANKLKFDSINADFYVTSLDENGLKLLSFPKSREVIPIGYNRGGAEWKSYIKHRSSEFHLQKSNTKYCLYILSTMFLPLEKLDEPTMEVLLRETLVVLNEFSKDLHIVFRPHAITDMEIFQKVLDDLNVTNYSIDYSHPMILSSNAQFVIGNLYSNTMFDAYKQSIPIVEYASYDKVLLEKFNKWSLGAECCDFFVQRDPVKLKNVINKIVIGDYLINRKESSYQLNISHFANQVLGVST